MNTLRLHPRADYPQSPIRLRFAIACFAMAVSATLIGGILGLFEIRSDEAMIARAAVAADATVVVDASSDAIRSMSINWPGRS